MSGKYQRMLFKGIHIHFVGSRARLNATIPEVDKQSVSVSVPIILTERIKKHCFFY